MSLWLILDGFWDPFGSNTSLQAPLGPEVGGWRLWNGKRVDLGWILGGPWDAIGDPLTPLGNFGAPLGTKMAWKIFQGTLEMHRENKMQKKHKTCAKSLDLWVRQLPLASNLSWSLPLRTSPSKRKWSNSFISIEGIQPPVYNVHRRLRVQDQLNKGFPC